MSKARQTGRGAIPLGAVARAGFTLIELLVVIVIIGVIAAIALPHYVKIKDKAREAEVKAGVHKIQTDLERFAVDNEGSYPPFLTGGDNAFLEEHLTENGLYVGIVTETPEHFSRDVLLRGGYLHSYPRDPFLRNEAAVRSFQAGVGDPLRNGTQEAVEAGTRFGPYSNLMGQVLCDARWLQWDYVDPQTGIRQALHTWSSVQYECYDVWFGNRSSPYLPGAFMYKSSGTIVPNVRTEQERDYGAFGSEGIVLPRGGTDAVTYPLSNDNYILGAWGGIRTKGQDILGEEPLVIFTLQSSKASANIAHFFHDQLGNADIPVKTREHFKLMGIAPWTRSVNRAHVGPLWGSPYGPSPSGDEQLSNANPNGMADGLIITLNGGKW